MRKLILISIIIIVMVPSHAQSISENDVPERVKSSFSKMFPDAIVKSWNKKGIAFEAVFTSGNNGSVLFKEDGKWIEYSTNIPPENLPSAAKQYLKKYSKSSIKYVEKITKSVKQIQYEVVIDSKRLFFDKNGIFIIEE